LAGTARWQEIGRRIVRPRERPGPLH
jgi:hypothetical protein